MTTANNPFGSLPQNPFGGGVFSFPTENGAAFAYTPAGSSGLGAPSGGDPNALAALQNSFVSQASNGLGAITSIGAAEFAASGNLFSQWANNLNSLSSSIAASFAQSVNNSAQACSGFFGCLF